ncbi:MMPL family transporter [Streptomyces canus]|uniref:MMPL family transporter n=1 Tax=Streptomyces canus TaxID=58343 RepID=UPI0038150267
MSRQLHRLGRAAAAHPWRTIALWTVALCVALFLAGSVGGEPHDDYDVPGTSSQAGTDLLRKGFPAMSGTEARVVLHERNGGRLDQALVERVTDRLRTVDEVGTAGPARLSGDGDTAIIQLRYTEPVTDLGEDAMADLRAAAAPAAKAGLQVEYAGQVAEEKAEDTSGGAGELVGLLTALFVLVVAFGSVVAAGLPIAVALIGLGVGSAGIGVIAALTDVSTTAPTAATMVGLGVGIDYALLLVTRHAEGLRQGLTPVAAAARATATAGQSVLFAGATVLVSVFGLTFGGLTAYYSYGYAIATVVASVMLTALTLVPALCALAGRRVLGRRTRREAATTDPRTSSTARWARRVTRRPLPWALASLALLLLLGAPALSMRTWPQDAGSQPQTNTVRRAYDLIADEYGAGAYAPLVVAVDLDRVDRTALPALATRLGRTAGVAEVSEPVVAPGGGAAVVTVQAAFGPQDERTGELVTALRTRVLPPGAEVTGVTAVFVDVADLLSRRLWLVIGIVVGLSVLLLVVVFRSILVPVKAALVNLLSVAAAYGVLTAVFQWGWGSSLLGLDHPVPVSTWVPILLFTVLFGLSMDYEVFLLSRVREDWLATRDPRGSVVRGLAATGRVITSAALIMVVVFAGFAADANIVVKMIGLGMATAVAVDATVVRMVLVPATMALFGRLNWWLPDRLDRILPTIDVEGAEPATGSTVERTRPVAADATGREPVAGVDAFRRKI